MEKEQIVNQLFASYVNTLKEFSKHASKYLDEDLKIVDKSQRLIDKITSLVIDIDKEILDITNRITQNKIKFAKNLASLKDLNNSLSYLEESLFLTNRLATLNTIKSVFTDILIKIKA